MMAARRFPVGCVLLLLSLPERLPGGVPNEVGPEAVQGDWLSSLPTLYTGPAGGPVQSIGLRGIVHLQYAHVDASQGTTDESEFRRFRFGVDSRFLDHFSFRGTVNFDPEGDRFYRSLSQVFLSFSPHGNDREDFERFRISVGKMKPRFSGEHSISPKRLKTFERSLLANQLAPAKTTGVLVGGEDGMLDYRFSVSAGEASPEFSWFDEGALLLAELGYSPNPELRIGLDYLSVVGDQEVTSDISHSVSLSADYNQRYTDGDWAFLADVLFGVGDGRQPDVFGLVLLGSYQIDPKWELVGRYQFATSSGPNGLRLQRRYERAVPGDGGEQRGERYQAAYLGVNYRIHGDQLKVMAGVEYSHLDGGGDGGDFDGWTWFAGLRTWF